MSLDPFPEHLDAVRLFARNGAVHGLLPISRLERLAESLANNSGDIAVELRFGHDAEQRQVLSGQLQTTVNVVCQRCMQPMQLALECTVELLVLENEEAVSALQGTETILDAIVMEPDGLDVVAILEDELILSLPLVPMHDEASCNEAFNTLQKVAVEEDKGSRTSPFAVLANLKSAAADQVKKREK